MWSSSESWLVEYEIMLGENGEGGEGVAAAVPSPPPRFAARVRTMFGYV